MKREKMEDFEELAPMLRRLADARPDPATSERIVAGAMERIQAKRRPWLLRPSSLGFAGGLAAAVGILALQLVTPTEGPTPPEGESAHPQVASGELLRNEGGSILAHALGPHVIELSPGARLQVHDAEPSAAELELLEGGAVFQVEALGSEGSFRVETEHLRVEVVGTRFRVDAEGSCSEVAVVEGRVRIFDGRGLERLLGPGMSERICQRSSAEAQLREALILVSSGRDLQRAAALLQRFRDERPQSPLQEEALFHLALVQARLGQMEEARRLAEDFATRYPNSERLERLEHGLRSLAPH